MKGAITRGLLLMLVLLSGCRKAEPPLEVIAQPPASLKQFWAVPEFSLVDRNGQPLTLADLKGKVWIADFFYTSCPGPCPMMSSRLSQLHQASKGLEDLVLISISTDPEKDTPAVLQAYAAKFGADERWIFLTGKKNEIFELANRGIKVSVTDEGGTEKEPVTHSTKLVLVDRAGMVRGFYEGLSPEENARILADSKTLLREPR